MKPFSMTETIRERLASEMQRDPSIFLMGEDIGVYGGAFGVTRGLIDLFGPERVRDTPISENTLVGAAIGAAMAGSRPVIEIMFMDFLALALDPLLNQAAKMRSIFGFDCPMVLRTPAGGGRGYGATHSQCLERLVFGIPGLQIVTPSDAADASALLATALRQNQPVIFVEHKQLYGLRQSMPDPLPEPVPFGQSRHLAAGDDLTIVAWSWMSVLACQAARSLEAEGIGADVIDLRTLAPLDRDAICQSAARTGRLLIIEEGPRTGGVAAEIAAQASERVYDCLDAPIRRLAMPDTIIPACNALEKTMIPGPDAIAAAARALAQHTG